MVLWFHAYLRMDSGLTDFLKMDSHIVIASKNGENPLISTIDPVNQHNLEIGIKSITYGDISESYFEFLVNGKRYILPIHLDEHAETRPTKLNLLDNMLTHVKNFGVKLKLGSLIVSKRKANKKGAQRVIGLTASDGVQILHCPRILKAKKVLNVDGISEWLVTNSEIKWDKELKNQDIIHKKQ